MSREATVFIESPHASVRVHAAIEFALAHAPHSRVIVVGASRVAAVDVVRRVTLARGFAVGLEAHTQKSLAGLVSRRALAQAGAVPVGMLTLEALVARIVAREPEALGRFSPIANEPGLARALARTLTELRLENVDAKDIEDASVRGLLERFTRELETHGYADPARVLHAAKDSAHLDVIAGASVLWLDNRFVHRAQADFFEAVTKHAARTFATFPTGDARARALLGHLSAHQARVAKTPSQVEEVASHLFSESHAGLAHGQGVDIFSAPGESREAAEIARRILWLAKAGASFDDMAVLLRAPRDYGPALEEAFERAKIPAYFARGTKKPDPAGRALLALLACAEEGLSASRFAEYLSLGELPNARAGEPPAALPENERWAVVDDETIAQSASLRDEDEKEIDPEHSAREDENENAPVLAGTIRSPKHWEKLLVDAAVIGGLDRWKKRLIGLRKKLTDDLGEMKEDDVRSAAHKRDIGALDVLRAYALPLLADLDALRRTPRTISEFVRAISELATRTLRDPTRVLSVLCELSPLDQSEPMTLSELILILEPRLCELYTRPTGTRYGRVYVAPIDDARGMVFKNVFVPGLVERSFPAKVVEDPIFLDRQRISTHASLTTNETRADAERLALRVALGAASERAVLSYPRVDAELARPRTPSFYALEIVRAATGGLSGFEELAERADVSARARIGWPAPLDPKDAIDESEHDLSLLARVLDKPESEAIGTARYLLSANPHLARALRFRAKRWLRTFSDADGMVDPPPEAKEELAKHSLTARSFSPTALQNFAACPYRFYLYAVHKLSPREEPEAIEEMDALQKGSFVHEVLYEFLTKLRAENLLPITQASLEAARTKLDDVLKQVDQKTREELCPAIDRVWEDGIAQIRADLREWLRRESEADDGFSPAYFELSFGLAGQRDASDSHSQEKPVELDAGLKLRGSIDLVEAKKDGTLRATDYKTGKKRTEDGVVIDGGKVLQPVLYALTLEKMFADAKVDGGRLYYATSTGGSSHVMVKLNEAAREGAKAVADAVGDALTQGFLPALPGPRECEYCDFKTVCGPYEEIRTKKKKPARTEKLVALRKRP